MSREHVRPAAKSGSPAVVLRPDELGWLREALAADAEGGDLDDEDE